MIKVNKLNPWPCKQKNCFKPAIYEFTNDMEDEKGEYKTINSNNRIFM